MRRMAGYEWKPLVRVDLYHAEMLVLVKGHGITDCQCEPRRLQEKEAYDNIKKLLLAEDSEN